MARANKEGKEMQSGSTPLVLQKSYSLTISHRKRNFAAQKVPLLSYDFPKANPIPISHLTRSSPPYILTILLINDLLPKCPSFVGKTPTPLAKKSFVHHWKTPHTQAPLTSLWRTIFHLMCQSSFLRILLYLHCFSFFITAISIGPQLNWCICCLMWSMLQMEADWHTRWVWGDQK